jgi:hypothetical protein
MIDNEMVGPERTITSVHLKTCDLCGAVVPQLSVVRVAGLPGVSEPVEVIQACDECRLRIEQDDVPFDAEVAAGLQAADEM